MPNKTIENVDQGYFGGFSSVERAVNSYRPRDMALWDRYVDLVAEGRLSEAAHLHMDRLAEAMMTDDLPVILGGSVDMQIREGFESISQNWRVPFRTASFSNFRQQSLAMLSDLEVDSEQNEQATLGEVSGTMPIVPEQGVYGEARKTESYEYATLLTYGCVFSITRQMLFNDDKRALAQIPRNMGVAMKRTINYEVAQVLEASASTSTSGMTMRDASRLFNTTAPTGSIINMYTGAYPLNRANIMTMMAYFANFTTVNGRIMNLRPKYLIVPPELQYEAESLCGETVDGTRLIGTPASNALRPDTVHPLQILTPVYLENLTSSVDWYLAADPAEYPTIEVGFLNGREEPELFQKNETGLDLHSSDGVQYKIRHDFDAYAVDRRGLLKVDDTT